MITQDRLKEIFSYDPVTGVFMNIQSYGSRRAGRQAGSPHNAGYIKLSIDGESHLAHRMAYLYMTGEMPTEHMDHINHVRNDNRWTNLRMVGRLENNRNKRPSRRSISGLSGVVWKERDRCWYAKVYDKNQEIYLGCFRDFFSAVCSRKSAEMRYGYHANHGQA